MANKKPDSDGYYYISGGEEVINLGKNRWDFNKGLDRGLFAQGWFFNAPIVDELTSRLLVENFTHYTGCLPTGAHAGEGKWHRDTYDLFHDEMLNLSLPPCYLTVLVPLVPMSKKNGATEIVPGSHKKPLREVEGKEPVYAETEVGDVVIFNGNVWHRGGPNNADEDRPVLYFVYHKVWYVDD